jgi:hypothetical protein
VGIMALLLMILMLHSIMLDQICMEMSMEILICLLMLVVLVLLLAKVDMMYLEVVVHRSL